MKRMIYGTEPIRDLLFDGVYRGYHFYIMSLGTHPVAYIDVINDYRYSFVNYGDITLKVHGALTYSENYLCIDNKKLSGWFIGWDYAHAFDQYADLVDGKKWTTEEIFEEVKNAIKHLINGLTN